MNKTLGDDPRAVEEAADTEKLLPSSEDDQEDMPPAYELKAPAKTATSTQVREYLVEVLRRRGVDSIQAENIASRWTIGTGVELREYPIDMYHSIFGSDEDLWAVYAAVKAQLYREAAPKEISKTAKAIILLISVIITSCFVLLITLENSETWRTVGIIGVWPAGIFNLIALCVMCHTSDPDGKAAGELRTFMEKKNKNESDKSGDKPA